MSDDAKKAGAVAAAYVLNLGGTNADTSNPVEVAPELALSMGSFINSWTVDLHGPTLTADHIEGAATFFRELAAALDASAVQMRARDADRASIVAELNPDGGRS